jgi:hypothetical protein
LARSGIEISEVLREMGTPLEREHGIYGRQTRTVVVDAEPYELDGAAAGGAPVVGNAVSHQTLAPGSKTGLVARSGGVTKDSKAHLLDQILGVLDVAEQVKRQACETLAGLHDELEASGRAERRKP